MRIGDWSFPNRVFLAPMAGITDRPFRNLCRRLGAGHAIGEMTSADRGLWATAKSRSRMDHRGERGPVHVQIAGSDPGAMADAARHAVARGADLVDINMGCPAKKVCHNLAGSSLLRDERLVGEILARVVDAVDVPVTLKTRTGWDRECRNAVRIGRMAESAGIACISLHGRTRNDFYSGRAEFDTLKALRDAVSLPLVANGDIGDAGTAAQVLDHGGADAVMIGRGAQERPWLPGLIARRLAGDSDAGEPDGESKRVILVSLVRELHRFYGEDAGVRIARKHISWQLAAFDPDRTTRRSILRAESAAEQVERLEEFLARRLPWVQAA